MYYSKIRFAVDDSSFRHRVTRNYVIESAVYLSGVSSAPLHCTGSAPASRNLAFTGVNYAFTCCYATPKYRPLVSPLSISVHLPAWSMARISLMSRLSQSCTNLEITVSKYASTQNYVRGRISRISPISRIFEEYLPMWYIRHIIFINLTIYLLQKCANYGIFWASYFEQIRNE